MNEEARRNVDLLVEQFWKRGYMTLSRRFGKYLPEPPKVGNFDVDIVAKYKNEYAIGITLNSSDFNNDKLIDKLNYLATRHTKYTSKRVLLFVGVPVQYYKNAKVILEQLKPEAKSNIKLFQVVERNTGKSNRRKRNRVLFS